MTDETDLRQFVHERFRRSDAKLDAVVEGLTEVRQLLSGLVNILAAQDNHLIRVEARLSAIERRLEMHDPALP